MPKKGSGKKKKKGSAKKPKSAKAGGAEPVDPAAGLTKEQLEGQFVRLKDELEREREERNFFQLERDKINTFWEITKRQLEETTAEMRNKDREIEETEERHSVEIKVYKQKVKHLLYEHQNQTTELKADAATGKKLAYASHLEDQALLRQDKRSLKVELKEMELSHEDVVKGLQFEYDKRITALREDMMRGSKEMQQKYETKMDELREDLQLQRKIEIHEIEERKNGQIAALMRNHDKAFTDIKNYYNDITLNNLSLIDTLKEQVEGMKKKEERQDKLVADTLAENRRLAEPLAQAKAELTDLRKQMVGYEKDKKHLATTKARVKVQDDSLSRLQWEHEVLQQRFEAVEAERDELYDRFVKTIYDVQQKSGFKNLLLEKKLGAVGDELERREAQLSEVLSAADLDPTALSVVTKKIEDVLDSKNTLIKDLEYEVARLAKAHNDLIKTCEAKLTQFGIPVEELGFHPMSTTKLNQTIGKGPAGLIAATS